jgi:hypothetical protein
MYIPRLDSSCKYYYVGAMLYRWEAPRDIEEDSVFRLKLTTGVPPIVHLSGKLRVSHADAASFPSTRMEYLETSGLSTVNVAGVALAVVISLLLTCWMTLRLRRGSQRIALE